MPLLHILFSRNYRFVLKFEQQLKDNGCLAADLWFFGPTPFCCLFLDEFWLLWWDSAPFDLSDWCLYILYIFVLHFILAGVEQKRVGLWFVSDSLLLQRQTNPVLHSGSWRSFVVPVCDMWLMKHWCNMNPQSSLLSAQQTPPGQTVQMWAASHLWFSTDQKQMI